MNPSLRFLLMFAGMVVLSQFVATAAEIDAAAIAKAQSDAVEFEKQNDWPKAEPLRKQVWDAHAERLLTEDAAYDSLISYAMTMLHQQKWAAIVARAEAPYVQTRERLKNDDRRVHHLATILALGFQGEGRHAEAEKLFRDVLEFRRRVLGTMDVETANCCGSLGGCLVAQEKFAEGRVLLQEAIDLRVKIVGLKHVDVAAGYDSLANCLRRERKYREAEAASRQAWHIFRELVGEKDGRTLAAQEQLIDSLSNLGQPTKAEPIARQLLELRIATEKTPSINLAAAHQHLAGSLYHLKRYGEAAKHFAQSQTLAVEVVGEDGAIAVAFDKSFDANYAALVQQLTQEGIAASSGDTSKSLTITFDKLYPLMLECYPQERFPHGHLKLAECLVSFAESESTAGNQPAARKKLEQALAMLEHHYPPAKYPQGHRNIAYVLNALSHVLHRHGEYAEASTRCQQALDVCRRVYSPDKYPDGHPLLASTLVDMAFMTGGETKGCQLYEEALSMQRKAYPASKFPAGHLTTLITLNQLGNALLGIKKYDRAAECLEEALQIEDRLRPGQVTMSRAMNQQYLARIYVIRGQLDEATKHLQDAVAFYRQIFPATKYPDGHGNLADLLWELGVIEQSRGQSAAAATALIEAERMRNRLAVTYIAHVSEAEALNYAVHHLAVPSSLLSAWEGADLPTAELYEIVWQRRGLLARMLAQRQRALTQSQSPEVAALYKDYQEVRQQLAQQVIQISSADELARLTREKERLERALVAAEPELGKNLLLRSESTSADLAKQLRSNQVFIDFLHYKYAASRARKPGAAALVKDETPCYVAFVVLKDKTTQRVELGIAEPIERAISAWRADIAAGRAGSAAAELRRLVWEPLAKLLSREINEVYFAPDGQLSNLPWAAIPGDRPSSVLLEEFAFASVPHGPFLFDSLQPSPKFPDERLLLVGDVDYGKPSPAEAVTWEPLPETATEVADLIDLAAIRSSQLLRGKQASCQAVLAELPKASVAHLATHGFFRKDSITDVRLEVGDGVLTPHRTSAVGRNPLTLSGLVLAGANQKIPTAENASAQAILTGEAIAALPLDRLRLVTLSACDTGLGENAGGEGVFGLQRAFHQAGARSVVASLWNVNDQAAAETMRLFYYKLWKSGTPPIHALREAQLAVYRHPGEINSLAASRGPKYDKLVKVLDGNAATAVAVPAAGNERTRYWASFVVSGGQ